MTLAAALCGHAAHQCPAPCSKREGGRRQEGGSMHTGASAGAMGRHTGRGAAAGSQLLSWPCQASGMHPVGVCMLLAKVASPSEARAGQHRSVDANSRQRRRNWRRRQRARPNPAPAGPHPHLMKRYLLWGSPICHSRPHSSSGDGRASPGCRTGRGLRGLKGSAPSAAVATPLERGVMAAASVGAPPVHLGRCL